LRLLKKVFIYQVAFPVELGWSQSYGIEFIPKLKFISLFTILISVFIYSKLVDMFKKHQLFYVIGSFYVALFSIVTVVLVIKDSYGAAAIGSNILAGMGVATYLATESFGSLIIALFWSYTVSVMKGSEAKRGFPFIIAVTQLGTIAGSSLMFFNVPNVTLLLICISSILILMSIIYYIANHFPKDQLESDKVEKKSSPDFLAGVKLLISKPYLMGVFVVSTFYEVAKSVVDYLMDLQGVLVYGDKFKVFSGIYGMSVNFLALLMALLGTGMLMKKFGLRFCLLLYPAMFGTAMIGLYLFYLTNPSPIALLWATFGVMMLVTATSYAVNNPVKEMMYIPTSKDAKFKVKGFTDMFGSRSAKTSGMQIGGALKVPGDVAGTISRLMGYGILISLGVIGVWLAVAFYVGQKNAQLTKDGEIVE
jgi:ATP:ADP antiporter, AAA family